VFTDLARKAGQLAKHCALTGWLHTSTRYAARHAMRTEQRRIAREQAAHAMSEEIHYAAAADADWARVSPVLDEALHEVNEDDRVAVLWRFFEGRAFTEMANGSR
jgi:DNA-directed RNA polymerase specialized sigma24 family protein